MLQRYARDLNTQSMGISHFQWGSLQTLNTAASPVRLTAPLTGHLVFLEAATTCHFRLGDAAVSATSSDPLLKPGRVYCLPRAAGETHVSTLVAAGSSPGIVEVWEADGFEPA